MLPFVFRSDMKGWINEPAFENQAAAPIHVGLNLTDNHTHDYSMLVAITISGGGMRAAAFGYGVLEGMRDTKIVSNGHKTTFLEEIDLIGGISGGSVLATYYALNGVDTFSNFREKFLYSNFQTNLITNILKSAYRLTSSRYGRTNVMMEQFNTLYAGKTFADLPTRPRLLISATDLATSQDFQFSPEQFALICSDLNKVPLAFAVAASSAAPIALSPLTLKNYNASNACQNHVASNNTFKNIRLKALLRAKGSYEKDEERPYIHLVDGAVSDNLGIRPLIDRTIQMGNIRASVTTAPPGSIRRIVFVVVNAERVTRHAHDLNKTEAIPDMLDVLEALRYGKGGAESTLTLDMLESAAKHWQSEMRRQTDKDSPFAPNSKLYIITVNLTDVKNPAEKERLMTIPTSFDLPKQDIDFLIESGNNALKNAPGYIALVKSL